MSDNPMESFEEPSAFGGSNLLQIPSVDDCCAEDEDVKSTIMPKLSPLPRRRSSASLEDTEFEGPTVIARKVSFADAFGLDLVSVKEFDTWDIPDTSLSDNSEEENVLLEEYALLPMFTLPLSYESLLQKLYAEKVALEAVELLPGITSMKGSIRVLNLSYKKLVYVRMTLDNWKSYYDILAEYIPDAFEGETDQFSFKISLVPPYQKDGAKLEFCIRYETPVGVFWDNNNEANYVLFCHKEESQKATEKPQKELPDKCIMKSCLKTTNSLQEETSTVSERGNLTSRSPETHEQEVAASEKDKNTNNSEDLCAKIMPQDEPSEEQLQLISRSLQASRGTLNDDESKSCTSEQLKEKQMGLNRVKRYLDNFTAEKELADKAEELYHDRKNSEKDTLKKQHTEQYKTDSVSNSSQSCSWVCSEQTYLLEQDLFDTKPNKDITEDVLSEKQDLDVRNLLYISEDETDSISATSVLESLLENTAERGVSEAATVNVSQVDTSGFDVRLNQNIGTTEILDDNANPRPNLYTIYHSDFRLFSSQEDMSSQNKEAAYYAFNNSFSNNDENKSKSLPTAEAHAASGTNPSFDTNNFAKYVQDEKQATHNPPKELYTTTEFSGFEATVGKSEVCIPDVSQTIQNQQFVNFPEEDSCKMQLDNQESSVTSRLNCMAGLNFTYAPYDNNMAKKEVRPTAELQIANKSVPDTCLIKEEGSQQLTECMEFLYGHVQMEDNTEDKGKVITGSIFASVEKEADNEPLASNLSETRHTHNYETDFLYANQLTGSIMIPDHLDPASSIKMNEEKDSEAKIEQQQSIQGIASKGASNEEHNEMCDIYGLDYTDIYHDGPSILPLCDFADIDHDIKRKSVTNEENLHAQANANSKNSGNNVLEDKSGVLTGTVHNTIEKQQMARETALETQIDNTYDERIGERTGIKRPPNDTQSLWKYADTGDMCHVTQKDEVSFTTILGAIPKTKQAGCSVQKNSKDSLQNIDSLVKPMPSSGIPETETINSSPMEKEESTFKIYENNSDISDDDTQSTYFPQTTTISHTDDKTELTSKKNEQEKTLNVESTQEYIANVYSKMSECETVCLTEENSYDTITEEQVQDREVPPKEGQTSKRETFLISEDKELSVEVGHISRTANVCCTLETKVFSDSAPKREATSNSSNIRVCIDNNNHQEMYSVPHNEQGSVNTTIVKTITTQQHSKGIQVDSCDESKTNFKQESGSNEDNAYPDHHSTAPLPHNKGEMKKKRTVWVHKQHKCNHQTSLGPIILISEPVEEENDFDLECEEGSYLQEISETVAQNEKQPHFESTDTTDQASEASSNIHRESLILNHISNEVLYFLLFVVFIVTAYHYDFMACFALYLFSLFWLYLEGGKRKKYLKK
ncbi:protein phosphatase 1 regulatory subunit 3A [Latimeria chalumnae]|uniref:protein phosphatase 1 regulatory subunit 3A n=1 Tax=Latimeria chalumnae TaxID=7897 RepID=UPI0003C117EF|nr:PREDICTED: protein phosphatase 1 regulatory subunit 3A-like [Latimeria chalumnae]|eukprot:XP_006005775.1 PREDICTED: protein phosphatase 1 regulatory subunit 3A-like [Latimeria chalumnae]